MFHLRLILTIGILAVFLSGCMDQGPKAPSTGPQETTNDLIAKILTPKAGAIISGDRQITFEARAEGGTGPYTYTWTSNLNGLLGQGQSLQVSSPTLRKGEHTIIVNVRDSAGRTVQGSVLIRAM